MYPSQQNATDQTSNFFWLIAIIAGVLLAIWWLKRSWFVIPIYYFRYYELCFFQFLLDGWDKVATWASWLHLPKGNPAELVAMKHSIYSAQPNHVDWSKFSLLNKTMGNWFRWFATPALLILAALAYFKYGSRKFTTTHSMQSLRETEQDNWPEIKPVLSLDLVKEDIEKGPWAMAKAPLDFCKEHNLVSVTEVHQRSVWKLDRGSAHRLLTAQVGPLWTRVTDLPIHMKALVVICIARAERERDIANNLLAQISRSAGGGKLDFNGVEAQLQKYKNSRIIHWLEQRHAYVYTMMASILEVGRSDGVLATAEFLWLKPVDRRLWFVLNSVGRQTSVVEISGAFSHWLTEKKLGRALRTPMIDEAVNALEANMLDTLHIGGNESWHTFNAA
ncbi:MAG: phosphoesterase [Coxiella sp. (in: Bacteria)]|nr:MAG: phosphoesterase [Coxiella sp. (in: g-proteobacteria)]